MFLSTELIICQIFCVLCVMGQAKECMILKAAGRVKGRAPSTQKKKKTTKNGKKTSTIRPVTLSLFPS